MVCALAVTGNARYFKSFMETEGFAVKVLNTAKFKIIVKSTLKNDRRDAYTIAMFLMKDDFMSESRPCSQYDEDIRRLLKVKMLAKQSIAIKNICGTLLSYGIMTTAAQFQSRKGRRQLTEELETRSLDRGMKNFERYKHYVAYCELVPFPKEFNETTCLGLIAKRGHSELSICAGCNGIAENAVKAFGLEDLLQM